MNLYKVLPIEKPVINTNCYSEIKLSLKNNLLSYTYLLAPWLYGPIKTLASFMMDAHTLLYTTLNILENTVGNKTGLQVEMQDPHPPYIHNTSTFKLSWKGSVATH
jgi:hypothetical protein